MPARPRRPILPSLLALSVAACGGGTPGVRPTPAPPLFSVEALVSYDENGNGVQDPGEVAVVPGEVSIAGRSARAAAGTGRATVNNVPQGTALMSLVEDSLPPFYQAGAGVEVTVPQPAGEIVRLGARLPIGENRPGIYMSFGDSITVGDGSFDYQGYRPGLEGRLRAHFGQGTIEDQSVEGTRTSDGSARISLAVRRIDPAYTLILYGTNDWNASQCRTNPDPPCQTVGHLRNMVRTARGAQSLPILGTIIPANTGFDGRAPESRNVWVSEVNDRLRVMAAEEGAVVADLHRAFLTAVPDFRVLFTDHVHPNDQGYAIMADEWFRAITTRPAEPSAASVAGPAFGFAPQPEP